MITKEKLIFVGIIAFALFLGKGAYDMTRGIRNKNPGNIKHGDNWLGMSDKQTDKTFVKFDDVKYGIRAIAKILNSYASRGIITVEQIISTWAPPSENDTQSYIKSVLEYTGWDAGHIVTREEGDYPTLIMAIIRQENGIQPYPASIINEGVSLA